MTQGKEQKAPPPLSNKQKKYLKGLAHKLSPLVLIGKEGITDNLVEAVNTELTHHELIKVKVGSNSGTSKHEAAEVLPGLSSSSLVQLIGKTVLLYRKNPKKDKRERIYLPKG